VKLHKQPGCWLRSSHAFKECVTAHWSIVILRRKYNGAKHSTEDAGGIFLYAAVEERSLLAVKLNCKVWWSAKK
jgi:hypothetical protein